MFGTRFILNKGAKDEAEKPFWISYADLMTSLMVLFLVVMSVALLTITDEIDAAERRKMIREEEIQKLLSEIKRAANNFPGMQVNMERSTIDFGPQAQFKIREYAVSLKTASTLRAFVRELLLIARQPLGEKWLKRVVIEGYTDKTGTYLYNLNLSLNRSHQVLCVLLEQPRAGHNELALEEKREVQKLFLVGGYSSNSAKKTDEESRRIELRLEFLGLDEKFPKHVRDQIGNLGKCKLE